MTDKIRVGVIGAGWWASEYHIPGLLAEAGAELAAVCDPHAGRLAAVAAAYPIPKTYADYREMLGRETLDAAVIVTPHATHYPIASACLERNLHLLIEKPMTLAARDARDLVQRAANQGRQIVIGYTNHYYPHVQQARRAILAGQIGAIQYVNSSFSSDVYAFLSGGVGPGRSPVTAKVHGPSENYNRPDLLGGGQGHLQLTHSIGLLFYLTGLRAERVTALMNAHGLSTDLVDAFAVGFAGGALGLVGGTGNAGGNYRSALAVYADNGCYVSDSLAGFTALRDQRGRPLPLDAAAVGGAAVGGAAVGGGAPPPYAYSVTRNFVEAIAGGENHAPGEIGWRAVELLEAAYRSAQSGGQPVLVEDLYR